LKEQPTHPESKPTHDRGHDIKRHAKSLKPVGTIKTEDTVDEHIVKSGSQFKLVSKKTGKNLGTYPTKAGAEKREREVQYFKHMKEDGGAGGAGGGGMSTGGSAGPTNVTGVKASTDPVSATAVHPKKKKKYMAGIRRSPPQM